MSTEDPVADFLAREQNDMAGLEDEFNDVNGHVDTNHSAFIVVISLMCLDFLLVTLDIAYNVRVFAVEHNDGDMGMMTNGDMGAATTGGVMNGRHDMQPSPLPQVRCVLLFKCFFVVFE